MQENTMELQLVKTPQEIKPIGVNFPYPEESVVHSVLPWLFSSAALIFSVFSPQVLSESCRFSPLINGNIPPKAMQKKVKKSSNHNKFHLRGHQ